MQKILQSQKQDNRIKKSNQLRKLRNLLLKRQSKNQFPNQNNQNKSQFQNQCNNLNKSNLLQKLFLFPKKQRNQQNQFLSLKYQTSLNQQLSTFLKSKSTQNPRNQAKERNVKVLLIHSKTRTIFNQLIS